MGERDKNGICKGCGATLSPGKTLCWACKFKFSNRNNKCQYYNETGFCLLKMEDCSPVPCKWFHERTENETKEGVFYE